MTFLTRNGAHSPVGELCVELRRLIVAQALKCAGEVDVCFNGLSIDVIFETLVTEQSLVLEGR